MTTKDVIKNKVYESLVGGAGWSTTDIMLILFAACLIACYIFAVYKMTSKAAFYSRDLNITIAGMVVVVAAVMIAMQSSLIVSLGMVGALSIVRFRNAVKNPLDLLYLFWAVSAGIICGVGLYVLAVILCAVMTIMLLILQAVPVSKANLLLILRSSEDSFDLNEIKELLREHCRFYKEKSCSIQNGETEVIYEIKTSMQEELLHNLKEIKKIHTVNLLSHDGEYRI